MKIAKRFQAFVLSLVLLLILTGCGTQAADTLPVPEEHAAVLPNTGESAPASTPEETNRSVVPENEQQTEAPSAASSEAPASQPEKAEGIPAAPRSSDSAVEEHISVCTVSISCASILNQLDQLNADKTDLVPSDGILLSLTEVPLSEGESAFDVLKRVCRENKIHLEFSETPIYQSAYIEGIGNLYEFDCGSGSGWMYRVNGVFPNYGCSRCILQSGDILEWVYTCDFGADIGGEGLG